MKTKSPTGARTLEGDLRRLQASASAAAGQLDRILHHTVSSAPILAVGTAAGVGFVLGGGLPRGALGVFLGIGARVAGAWLQEEFLERPFKQE